MLAGKDRGKQGRIVDARPRDGKVVVENLNIAEEAPEAAPDPRREPHGRHADRARRDHREPAAVSVVERDARLPDVQAADPRRLPLQGGQGRDRSRCASASARAAARRSTSDGRDRPRHLHAAPEAALQRRAPRAAAGAARPVVDHAVADDHEDHAQHGRRRGRRPTRSRSTPRSRS